MTLFIRRNRASQRRIAPAMHHSPLHAALRAFAEESATALAADVADGAEVPFELAEEGGRRRTPLYCYRPLTGAYIRERLGKLAKLATYAPAARELEALEGLEDYLRLRGEQRVPRDARDRADASLRVFVDRVFEDSTDFVLDDARFDRALAELEGVVVASESQLATLIVGLPGLRLRSPEVALANGIVLRGHDGVPGAPDDAAWLAAIGDEPNALAVLTLTDAVEADAAPARLQRLVRALRLYDAGSVGLAPAGWVRLGDGPWQLVDLAGGSPAGWTAALGPLELPEAQEDELRAFVSLAGRRMPRGGELAWALRRFDLACERPEPGEALTDLLLALRALLEPEGPDSGLLPRRLAALCALEDERDALAERAAAAIECERALVAGLAAPGVTELAAEMAEHTRALLGDTLCGHLDQDLRGAADALLTPA
jgi:hypothetical protein